MVIIAPCQQRERDVLKVSIFFNMKVCCVFPLESPYQGESNENTQHTIINMKTRTIRNYPKINNVCNYGILLGS